MPKDTSKRILVAAAMTSVLALSIQPDAAIAAKTEMEKCAGIAKVGMNDCAANGHDCGGMSKKAGDPNEWIALPKGTCNKIVGAKVTGTEKSQDIKKTEKCAGIVKAGLNDCAANGHSCAKKASKNKDPNEWVYVPEGSCQKIVGASVKR
jgi:uncharacterized membrane protein